MDHYDLNLDTHISETRKNFAVRFVARGSTESIQTIKESSIPSILILLFSLSH